MNSSRNGSGGETTPPCRRRCWIEAAAVSREAGRQQGSTLTLAEGIPAATSASASTGEVVTTRCAATAIQRRASH